MSNENQQNKRLVRILPPLPFGEAFTYAWNFADFPQERALVSVPFGRQTLCGVVWRTRDVDANGLDESKIKPVLSRFDLPPLPDSLTKFVDWVAGYTLFPKGSVLKLCLTSDDLLKGRETAGYVLNLPPPESMRLTAARQKVLSLRFDKPQTLGEIAAQAGVSSAVVSELAKAGVLLKQKCAPASAPFAYDFHGASLSEEQTQAANVLKNAVDKGFRPYLLHGVTGSGKTEVYFQAIAQALKENRQVLVLLPEIGLTAQWVDRFEKRFGAKPALWHSDLTPATRRDTWQGVLKNEIKIVAGARSALFLPFSNLGLIIVDEEHDSSYKQEEGVTYHARNMAVVRAKIENIPVVLSSATPSLETLVNAANGRYEKLVLKNRYNNAVLPDIKLIDMRQNPPVDLNETKSFLSPVLVDAMTQNLENGEQSLLFLNRRGYAPLVLCRACGHRFQCPYCAAWLVEHRTAGRLICHHCGYSVRKPAACPVCEEKDSLTSCGPGAERIFEEIKLRFADASSLLITSDSVASPKAFEETLRQIESNEANIIVATQMLAKGYHFSHLTLVGIVDADSGLQGGDLRAGERTFQLLQQVAGRSGRESKKGRVLMQTFAPDNTVIQALASDDPDAFLQAERQAREELSMPPFGRMAAVVVSSRDNAHAQETAFMLGKTAPYGKNIHVYGPAPAPLALLRGKYRYRLLLQTGLDAPPVQNLLSAWLKSVKTPNDVQIKADVDPYSFF